MVKQRTTQNRSTSRSNSHCPHQVSSRLSQELHLSHLEATSPTPTTLPSLEFQRSMFLAFLTSRHRCRTQEMGKASISRALLVASLAVETTSETQLTCSSTSSCFHARKVSAKRTSSLSSQGRRIANRTKKKRQNLHQGSLLKKKTLKFSSPWSPPLRLRHV